MISFSQFELNLHALKSAIATACEKTKRDPSTVKILAVTKEQPVEAWHYATQTGCFAIGENRVALALEKSETATPPLPRLEFIGHLQSNKAKQAALLFNRIESVTSLKLLKILNTAILEANRPPLRILLEINTGNDPAKTSAPLSEAPFLLDYALSHCPSLQVEGLMAMAPLNRDPAYTFGGLQTLQHSLQDQFKYPLLELSMGMSQDFSTAITHGSTLIRIGSLLFQPLA